MNAQDLRGAMQSISNLMAQNKDYLVELDAQNGDGDLGISMNSGFQAVAAYLAESTEIDLGKLFMKSSSIFNESAPSSLGTILSLGMMGMAKMLKGKTQVSTAELSDAMQAGVNSIMERAKSKPGEKTILDSLCPAIEVIRNNSSLDKKQAFLLAAKAASEGSENTKQMKSVHGRAAYYGDKSIGVLDGGSVVGKLIFEGISQYCQR